jgi:hypothetical protein
MEGSMVRFVERSRRPVSLLAFATPTLGEDVCSLRTVNRRGAILTDWNCDAGPACVGPGNGVRLKPRMGGSGSASILSLASLTPPVASSRRRG